MNTIIRTLLITLVPLATLAHGSARPLDVPPSNEPRVVVATCQSSPGLITSEGTGQPFLRANKGEELHSRDLLLAIPGFRVDIEPASKNVALSLWGNLPGMSESPCLLSSVILHDSRAYDLDFTALQGRFVLTNTKAKGAAKIWLRTERGVQLTLAAPGDSIAIELYGRWPSGVAFSLKNKGQKPVQIWDVYCLKGSLDIKAGKDDWHMTADGKAHFHGNSVDGPNGTGPEKPEKLPSWADPKAKVPELVKGLQSAVKDYTGKLKEKTPDDVARELLRLADKEKDALLKRVMRTVGVHAMAAMDEVIAVADLLEHSSHDDIRKSAVVALRHWIGARQGRDEMLYEGLLGELHYSKVQAEAILELLHSPFDPKQPATYSALINYLKHPKQAIRELAHWHLVRLAPAGNEIPYDAGSKAADREKAVAAWKKLVPDGEIPKDKDDDTKKDK